MDASQLMNQKAIRAPFAHPHHLSSHPRIMRDEAKELTAKALTPKRFE